MKYFYLVLVLLSFNSFAQKDKKKSFNDENFKLDSLPNHILRELNRFRAEKGLDRLEFSDMLNEAAYASADDMAGSGKDKVELSDTKRHLKQAGATKRGEEVTMKAPISKGRESYKTADVAKVIYNRWESNVKNLQVLTNPKFTLIGLSCVMDDENKKVFVSGIFGGYDITNGGAPYRGDMEVPYNKTSKKIKDYDPKKCKNCERWRNYDVLHKGISVSDGKIYLEFKNSRELRRLLKKTKDGLAVDIVQREQYVKADYNIVDNDLYNKGVMTKVVYKDKFFKSNLLTKNVPKNKKNKIKGIKVEMGKFNKKITGPYEINIIVVQDGKYCKTITRGYTESGNIDSNTPIGIMPVKGTTGLKPPFEPRSESSILTFNIPFEKNKYEFKPEDIQPFIKAMNEPDFIIDGLYIYAYSSIEGDSVANAKLQRKRAESVTNVLQSMQQNKIKPTIETKDSWGLFMLENEDGKYANLVNMGKRKCIQTINSDQKLQTELEPILAKERFAQIVMDVTYDVSGPKEQKFAEVSFARAIKANNLNQAYKIMEFIGKRIVEGRYPESILDSLKFPETPIYAPLVNNKIYYRYQKDNIVEDEDEVTFDKLIKIDAANPIYTYNKVFCQLKLDSNAGNPEHQAKVQQTIDGLYGKLDSSFVNGLNIEWQFKIMESVDTLENADAIIDACIARIKSFYNIKDASWQNALKLSYVFSKSKDYRYAATVLEPYLKKPDVTENLIFMYISSASRVAEKYYSRTFAYALDLAKQKNPTRYCKLFGEPYMTFQVLENPEVKKTYYSAQCPENKQ
ncbi:MAG: CAP domain-containing protein [Sphingobacteriaceae bacterium]